MELRKEMSEKDVNGNPALKPEWYGKVLTVDGQSISSRNLRFSHCIVSDWKGTWRPDKTKHDCILEKAILLNQVM
jgi:hypothetical protein